MLNSQDTEGAPQLVSCLRLWLTRYVAITNGGPFYEHGLTLIPAWMSNYIHYTVWDEITYQFLNFNGATVEV